MKTIKIPCEHDLLSNNHETWANAMVRCQHAGAFCGADGYCHNEGNCFVDQELTREQAILEIDQLTQQLHTQKQKIDSLNVAPRRLIAQLEIALEQNITKRNEERVFAIKFCIAEIKRVVIDL